MAVFVLELYYIGYLKKVFFFVGYLAYLGTGRKDLKLLKLRLLTRVLLSIS